MNKVFNLCTHLKLMLNIFLGISQQITRKEIQREEKFNGRAWRKKIRSSKQNRRKKDFWSLHCKFTKSNKLMGKFYFKCLFLFNTFNLNFVVLKNSVAMHKNLMIFQLSKKKKRAFKKWWTRTRNGRKKEWRKNTL